MADQQILELHNKSDVQIFRICASYYPTSQNSAYQALRNDMADSPSFYSSEIRDDRFTDFCVHTAQFSGNQLQKVSQLKKIGQWDHGIRLL